MDAAMSKTAEADSGHGISFGEAFRVWLRVAVLSFGGFLGIGDDHYPLPWQSLKYDTGLGGYRTGITESQLKGAPKYGNDNSWNWADPTRARAVNEYYGIAI